MNFTVLSVYFMVVGYLNLEVNNHITYTTILGGRGYTISGTYYCTIRHQWKTWSIVNFQRSNILSIYIYVYIYI